MNIIKCLYNKITARKQYTKYLWFYVDLYDMRPVVEYCIRYQHMSLEDAMIEWDIYPYDLSKQPKEVSFTDVI